MIYRLLLFLYSLLPERLQEVVEWLMSTKTTAGVSVVAFDPDGRVLMFQHQYHPAGSWRLPGGHAHRGELPEEALARELAEEGGAVVELGKLVHIDVSQRWPARMTMYYAGALVRPPERRTAEVKEWRFCTMEDLPADLPARQRIAIERAVADRNREGGEE